MRQGKFPHEQVLCPQVLPWGPQCRGSHPLGCSRHVSGDPGVSMVNAWFSREGFERLGLSRPGRSPHNYKQHPKIGKEGHEPPWLNPRILPPGQLRVSLLFLPLGVPGSPKTYRPQFWWHKTRFLLPLSHPPLLSPPLNSISSDPSDLGRQPTHLLL